MTRHGKQADKVRYLVYTRYTTPHYGRPSTKSQTRPGQTLAYHVRMPVPEKVDGPSSRPSILVSVLPSLLSTQACLTHKLTRARGKPVRICGSGYVD